ncbi:MAG: hypothetical protein QOJ91_736 [Sphingomonadales bacterium]|jgi:hypothetical protein|nr:hypothetical protein [Sphingomonadales bacterium]
MTRLLTLSLLAFMLTAFLFGGTAFAAGASQYRAELAKPAAASRLVARDIIWRCGAAGCVAVQGHSRPAVDCPALAQQVGTLISFTVGGVALAPAELEKCNGRAR